MKKLVLMPVLFLVMGLYDADAQTTDLKLAAHAGVPVNDAGDISNFNLAADVTYLLGIAGIVEAGAMAGVSRYFEGGDSGRAATFLPVAAAGRVDLPGFFAGLDLGYAIGLSDNFGGGLYYRPKIGFGFFGFNVIGSYSGINTDDGSISAVTVGVEIGL